MKNISIVISVLLISSFASAQSVKNTTIEQKSTSVITPKIIEITPENVASKENLKLFSKPVMKAEASVGIKEEESQTQEKQAIEK